MVPRPLAPMRVMSSRICAHVIQACPFRTQEIKQRQMNQLGVVTDCCYRLLLLQIAKMEDRLFA